MGSRGPLPTPTPILKARGSWLVGRRRNEPVPEAGRPKCPAWLSADAKQIWRTTATILERMRVLTKADGVALERYSYVLARWRKEADFIERHGTTYPVKRDGEVLFKLFPSVKVFDMLTTQLGRLEGCFGLNPAARSRIIALSEDMDEEVADDDDKVRKFIKLA